VALSKPKKGSLNGKKKNSPASPRGESVIAKVASFLRRERQVRYIIKIPLNKPIGKVFYTVESTIEPVTFYKRKDAECFKKLLNTAATNHYKADIIRREVTEDGFIPTYGVRK
jgi:hypothetical protein